MINKYKENNKMYSYTKFAQQEGINQDKKIGYFLPKPHEIGDVWDAMEYFALNYSNDIEFSIMFKYFDRIMDFYEHYDYVAYVDYNNKNPKKWDILYQKVDSNLLKDLEITETHFDKMLERRERLKYQK